jgi:hypothetical protein
MATKTAPRPAGTPASGGPWTARPAPAWRAPPPTSPAAPCAARTRPGSGAAGPGGPHIGQLATRLHCGAHAVLGGTHHSTTATPPAPARQVRPNRPGRPTAAVSSGASHQRQRKHQPDAAAHQRHGLGAHGVARLVGQQGRHGGRHGPCALQAHGPRAARPAGRPAAASRLPAANTSRPKTMTRLRPSRSDARPRATATAPASGRRCPWPGRCGPGRRHRGTAPPPARTPAAPGTGPACAGQKCRPATGWRDAPRASWWWTPGRWQTGKQKIQTRRGPIRRAGGKPAIVPDHAARLGRLARGARVTGASRKTRQPG